MLRRISALKGTHLDARDGTIGKVKDLLFDDESWTVRYLVADTGRWLPGRRVLLSPASIVAGGGDDKKLPVDLTKSQIENSPGEETDQPASAQYQRDIHTYYGWPAYWGVGPYPMAGVLPPVVTQPPPAAAGSDFNRGEAAAGDPHLRSADHVSGYDIQATDGSIGHVEDFLVDVNTWVIRALVIDTRNWLPGKKVVVAPEVIDRVSWTDSEVAVHLSREAVKESPEYSPDLELPSDFGDQLAAYYEGMATPRR